jgi:hypothetical protein
LAGSIRTDDFSSTLYVLEHYSAFDMQYTGLFSAALTAFFVGVHSLALPVNDLAGELQLPLC